MCWACCGFFLPCFVCATVIPPKPEKNTVVQGEVRDMTTAEPIGFVQILIEELRRSATSEPNGRFSFGKLPQGQYTLKTFRVGYQPLTQRIDLVDQDTLHLTISLSAYNKDAGVVEIVGNAQTLEKPALSVNGSVLRQNLSGTIAQTMIGTPGLAMRSMGPAPARPILRGLGGDRLMILEDGGKTGDLSGTAADHAVVIEPLNAERIDILRGAPALAYSSSALGGVINVVRNLIPNHLPESVHLGATLQTESVNKSLSTGYFVGSPLGKSGKTNKQWAMHSDGAFRQTQDLNTPIGLLENTNIRTFNGSLGVSRIRENGFTGAAFSHYNSQYGIPGGFVGAHPNGVRIHLYRNQVEAHSEWLPSRNVKEHAHTSHWTRIEAKTNFTYYFHQEFESPEIIGLEFQTDELTTAIRAQTKDIGIFQKGMIGIEGFARDYNIGGLIFAPNAKEQGGAFFAYQEMAKGKWIWQIGSRFDAKHTIPDEEKQARIGWIRRRAFSGVSGSTSLSYQMKLPFSIGFVLNRAVRMPALEELFTEGPHLAAYSYDVGNPNLNTETGWGAELVAKLQLDNTHAHISLFQNRLSNYIFLENTGQMNFRTLLPIYQYKGDSAKMWGVEGSFEQNIGAQFAFSSTASYVNGTLASTKIPLPQMPPFNGNAGISWKQKSFTLGANAKFATAQERLGEFEIATAGYIVPNVSAQFIKQRGKFLHTLNLGIENITNTEYRDHLSRVKSIMPEAGRNVKVLYKMYW